MKAPVTRVPYAPYAPCVAIVLAALLAGGCNLAPKYVVPSTPSPEGYKEAAPAQYDALPPGTWRPAQPQDAALKGKWWEIFNEPELNALEDQLNINNQNIALAFQNFMAARAQVRQARAGYFPTLTTAPAFNRTGVGSGTGTGFGSGGNGSAVTNGGGSTSGAVTNEWTLPFEASWAPDLFGRIRNTVHEFQYAAQVSAADLENERLSEQAALAEFYFELRGQDALQDLFNRTIEYYRQSLKLTQALYANGIDSQQDVAQAEVTLENAEATAVGVGTNRAIFEHAIATLIGTPASSFSMPVVALTAEAPPIPIGIPSELLQRRPDIAAAERTMAQANALIGVEKAAYFPSLALTGGAGFQSSLLSKLFTLPALVWSLGASATETIFDGGLRNATVAQYRANYNADVAAYRQTVLTAFQQVEDFTATMRITSHQLVAQDSAVAAAQRFVDIATTRYKSGLDPYLDVITAQQTLLTDQQTQLTLRVTQMTAAVELVQAVGGGWDVSRLPTPGEVTSTKGAQMMSNPAP